MFVSETSVDCTGDIYVSENACFSSPAIAPVTPHYVQQDHAYTDALNEITVTSYSSPSPDIGSSQQCTSNVISQAVESTLNESLCGLFDKSKELVKTAK